jgi:Swiss Army Knife RNA repair-like protein
VTPRLRERGQILAERSSMKWESQSSLDCLFLDYDGVVHGGGATRHRKPPNIRPELPGHQLFEHLPIVESLLAPYPAVRIVLSTSWVRSLDFDRAKSYLTPGLQQRVIGATYHRRLMLRREFADTPRYAQIFQDVERRRPHRWLAIDDDFGEGVPQWAWTYFVQTPSTQGLGCPAAVEEFKRRLEVVFNRPPEKFAFDNAEKFLISPELARNAKVDWPDDDDLEK